MDAVSPSETLSRNSIYTLAQYAIDKKFQYRAVYFGVFYFTNEENIYDAVARGSLKNVTQTNVIYRRYSLSITAATRSCARQ